MSRRLPLAAEDSHHAPFRHNRIHTDMAAAPTAAMPTAAGTRAVLAGYAEEGTLSRRSTRTVPSLLRRPSTFSAVRRRPATTACDPAIGTRPSPWAGRPPTVSPS